MRLYLKVVVIVAFVMCFLSVLPHNSWSNEEEKFTPEGILDPLCDPCKKLCKATLKAIPISNDMKCNSFGTLFSTICEVESGGTGPEAAVLCFASGAVTTKICEEYYGSPQKLIQDPGGAAKHICKGVKLCR